MNNHALRLHKIASILLHVETTIEQLNAIHKYISTNKKKA